MKLARLLSVLMLLVLLPYPGSPSDDIGLLIGLIPDENIFKQMDRYKPVAEYITEKLGIKVKLTILSRYGYIIDRFVSKGLHGAFFGSFTGAQALKKLDVEPLVRPEGITHASTIKSYIFVRKDSGIISVRDMKGKRVVFVDKSTTTGYLFALYYFKTHGVASLDEYFSEYSFSGSHGSSILSVLDNRADIGVVKNTAYEKALSKDPILRKELYIIAESQNFPDITLCIKKDISPEVKKSLKEVLLSMHNDPAGRVALSKFKAVRFIEAKESDFMPVYNLAKKAGVDIR